MNDHGSPPPASTPGYLAWNGRTYPWPPPPGWMERSDGRYWPPEHEGLAWPGSFRPQHGPTAGDRPRTSPPPPRSRDRHGAPPWRARSIVALAVGATSLLIASSFVRFDVLGFTLEPADFGVDGAAEPDVRIAPIGEERRLSAATVAELLHLRECRSDVGAIAEGEVSNPLESERAYLITVQFFVDGERQLDGFAEVVVPPGVTSSFSAVSASPPVDGAVECRFGDVFRFIPD